MSQTQATLPGIEWDCGSIPRTASNPPYILPTFLLVRVTDEVNPKFIIIKTSFVNRNDHDGPPSLKFWKVKVLDNPFLLIRGGETWYEDGTPLDSHKYYIERDATEVRPLGIYSTFVQRTKNYMIMPHLNYNDRVYEYTFTYPKNCLPPKYNYVKSEKDIHETYHFKGGVNMCNFRPELHPPAPITTVVPPPVAPPASQPKQTIVRIPTFVFHAYVTGAIDKQECCPVTLEPLSKENVGCAPCGHLFDKDALKTALQTNGKCPTCRQSAKPDEIQVW
jgi:hypothetical protein